MSSVDHGTLLKPDHHRGKLKLTSLPEDSPPEPETQASEHSAITPNTPGTPTVKDTHTHTVADSESCTD